MKCESFLVKRKARTEGGKRRKRKTRNKEKRKKEKIMPRIYLIKI